MREIDDLRTTYQDTVQGIYSSYTYPQYKTAIEYVQMRLNGIIYSWGELHAVAVAPVITMEPDPVTVPDRQRGHLRVGAAGDALIYEWVVNGQWVPYAITAEFTTPPLTEGATVRVRVRNFAGYLFSRQVQVSSTEQPPVYTLSATAVTMDALGEDADLRVTTSQEELSWRASSGAEWIEIVGRSSGIGSGSISYRVAANDSPDARVGVIQVGDAALTVTQEAAAWTYAEWQSVFLPEDGMTGPSDDFSGDGLSNYLNYALGFDPRQDNTPLLVPPRREEDESGNAVFTMFLIRSKTARDLQFTLRSTVNLRDWVVPDLEPVAHSQYPNPTIYKVSVPVTPGNQAQFFREDVETAP